MTTPAFEHLVLAEQVRAIETKALIDAQPETATDLSWGDRDFSGRVVQRAQALVREFDLADELSEPAHQWQLACWVLLGLAVLFGALASMFALVAGETVNVYWLLLVLLGFNFLSMLLWVLGVTTGMENLVAGVFARASSFLPARLRREETIAGQSARAWYISNLGPGVGKWRLSALTHQAWVCYLLAGFGTLVVVLLARQFDFVWGTTLLSDEAFVTLTGVLSQPLEWVGLTTPSAAEVLETRIGDEQVLGPAHRNHWAQFLLGSLCIYGVLPRFLLYLISRGLLRKAQGQFALDHYLPYYIELRQLLMPLSGKSEIVDADIHADQGGPSLDTGGWREAAQSQVPQGAKWVGLELAVDSAWPPVLIDADHDLGRVLDRETLQRVKARIEESADVTLAVAVPIVRVPDRGVRRTVAELYAHADSAWLVLLDTNANQPVTEARLTDWYRVAEASGVKADHVIRLGVG